MLKKSLFLLCAVLLCGVAANANTRIITCTNEGRPSKLLVYPDQMKLEISLDGQSTEIYGIAQISRYDGFAIFTLPETCTLKGERLFKVTIHDGHAQADQRNAFWIFDTCKTSVQN